MSIRLRLVALCLIISLLPALPLSFLVKSLLEKSFDVGLSDTIEKSLQSGLVVSRIHLEQVRTDFESDVRRILAALPDHPGKAATSTFGTNEGDATESGSLVSSC